jgi:hypothetical protein
MSKITLGETEFDLDNPDHYSFLRGVAGWGGGPEYSLGMQRLSKYFDVFENVIEEGRIVDQIWKLNYSKLNPEFVKHYLDKQPEIILSRSELGELAVEYSKWGVDVAGSVLQYLSEKF